MGKYKKYHSDVKVTYALKLQDELLPNKFTSQIPNSTTSYWKDNEKPERYVGSEFASNIQTNLNDTKVFLDPRVHFGKEVFIQMARFYITILNLIGKERVFASIVKNKNVIVQLLENLNHNFPFEKKILLLFLNISQHRYSMWLGVHAFACDKSLANTCFKKRPNQVALFEIEVLKKYMNKKSHQFWSIGAIWGKAVKDGAISMSSASWYKYSKKLGLSEARKPKKKSRKKGSLDVDRPNHTWHMDVSQYKTMDNVKFYIYTVVDNFSRKIVSHHLSRKLSAQIRVESLRKGILNEFNIEIKGQHLDLIVDGGSENNNHTVADFIKNCEISIQKKIALKDVTFSNSIVEGPYKIMKSYYFRKKEIYADGMQKELDFFINDYNNLKPCHKHKFFTPYEVHLKPDILESKPIISNCNEARLEANRNYCCKLLLPTN
ncbi:DDE-type integrase/transposase/recombinase [Polaribacter cellanae]|uniref:Transposase family protein n=1 Tax=Polaribacter cellanae TaxID=2818493 RepID=A0A975CNV4_9FLAO|nr:DDE-type integrase/transposase/recombinase [Polaribacter cellanae]QTE21132.1 transposase family protein [Polaribacter cellanae]